MAIFKKDTTTKTFPAYTIAEREPMSCGAINITPEDILGIDCGEFYRKYQAGSVVSHALKNNDCPIEAVERCKRSMEESPYNGHCLHWINQIAATLVASHYEQKRVRIIEVRVGMKVRFQGKYFTITAENNNNLGLKEI